MGPGGSSIIQYSHCLEPPMFPNSLLAFLYGLEVRDRRSPQTYLPLDEALHGEPEELLGSPSLIQESKQPYGLDK
jgi:hypothetical protein